MFTKFRFLKWIGDSLEHFYGEKTGGKVAVSPMTRKRTPQYGTGRDHSLSKATHSAAVASATRVGSPRAHGESFDVEDVSREFFK